MFHPCQEHGLRASGARGVATSGSHERRTRPRSSVRNASLRTGTGHGGQPKRNPNRDWRRVLQTYRLGGPGTVTSVHSAGAEMHFPPGYASDDGTTDVPTEHQVLT